MQRNYIALGLFTMALTLAISPSLLAEHERRTLSGTVADRHHEPLRGAVVQAENVSTQTVMSYITGSDGHYSFKRLDRDCDYRIVAIWHGWHSASKNLSLFDSNRAKVINLTIRQR